MWLVRGTYLHWLYVGHKKLGVGCVLVVCVGRVLVGPILVVTYGQISGFGGRTLVVRVSGCMLVVRNDVLVVYWSCALVVCWLGLYWL